MSTFFQLRTVLNNIQELISSCSKQPLTLHPGPPWTVWAARMGGGRSLSRRLTTTARKWLSSGSTSNLSTSTGIVFFVVLLCCLFFMIFFFRALLLELKQMKDLHHDHLTRWVGACLEEGEFSNRMPSRRASILDGNPHI